MGVLTTKMKFKSRVSKETKSEEEVSILVNLDR